MYQDHASFEKPEDEKVKIWRYMDFVKYVWMLKENALFFCTVNRLEEEDPHEGSFVRSMLAHPQICDDPNEASQLIESIKNVLKKSRVTVNCWHINAVESAAMWKLYSQGGKGIAIVSSFARLKESLKGFGPAVFAGKVIYIDSEKEWIKDANVLSPFMYKRKSFEHESELRAVLWTSNSGTEDGVRVPIDLSVLIEEVIVSPHSPGWVHPLVVSVTEKYGLEVPVERSTLMQPPPF